MYFVKIVVLLLGEQMRVSVFPGVDLSDKQRLEPAVFTERHKAPVAIRREAEEKQEVGHDFTSLPYNVYFNKSL